MKELAYESESISLENTTGVKVEVATTYSIIIVSYNCLESLDRCLQSVFQHSDEQTEVIVVDNHSTDGTAEMLSQHSQVNALYNDSNLGFSKACNLGAEQAQGEFLVFLNPDTQVTEGWLTHMQAYFAHESVGAVGPLSNYVAGLQKVDPYVPSHNSPLSIDGLAEQLRTTRTGQGIETKLLIGFCLMIRRSLFSEIGSMDENLFLGNDDLDLSWRLREKKYQLVVATDAFVYHEGQVSFNTEPKNKTQKLVQESTDALYQKLVQYYENPELVPSPEELWGISWFQPSEFAYINANKDQQAKTPEKENAEQTSNLSFLSSLSSESNALVVCQPTASGIPSHGTTLGGNDVEILSQDHIVLKTHSEGIRYIPSYFEQLKKQCPNLQRITLWHSPSDESSPQRDMFNIPYNREQRTLRNQVWSVGWCPSRTAEELQKSANPSETTDYLITCFPRSAESTSEKLVSIIILAFNQLNYTKQCIDSIRQHTRQNYELILVNNGSTDGTSEYFTSLEQTQSPHDIHRIKLISNTENLGVARGWNQGLQIAEGEYLLVFNNDTIVTPNWLSNMVRLAESDPSIGLVGPRSNNISGPQKIEQTGIQNIQDIQTFGQKWQSQQNLSAQELERVTGFSMLFSREVFQKIGFFDERFGKGNFEDDDYCVRTRYAGYQLMMANDSFVFHFGSVSFSAENLDWKALMQENHQKFNDKWAQGESALSDTQYTVYPEEGNTSMIDSVVSTQDTSETSLETKDAQTWIARAQEAYQNQDLAKAQEYYLKAEELNPNIPDIYNGLGILAFHQESFTDAISLFRKGLDLEPTNEDIGANIYDVFNAFCDPTETQRCLNVLKEQFPDNLGIQSSLERHKQALSEQTVASSTPTASDLPQEPIDTHSLSSEPIDWQSSAEELIYKKQYQEALNVLEPKLLAQEDLASCYNYMGIIAYECQDYPLAWKHFQQSVQHHLQQDSYSEDVLLNYHDAGLKLGKQSAVLKTLEEIIQNNSDNNLNSLAHMEELQQCYKQLQQEAKNGSWNSDLSIESREKNIAGENLLREGLHQKSQEIFQEVLNKDPQNFRSLNNMGLALWYQGDEVQAKDFFLRALTINATYEDAWINAFDASLALQDIPLFQKQLEESVQKNPNFSLAKNLLKHIHLHGEKIYTFKSYDELEGLKGKLFTARESLRQGDLDQATLFFLEIIESHPQDFSAFNGLGVIAHQRKMYSDAQKLLETALELNPLDQDTLLNLWDNSQYTGKQKEALTKLSSALEIDPNLENVRNIIQSAQTS